MLWNFDYIFGNKILCSAVHTIILLFQEDETLLWKCESDWRNWHGQWSDWNNEEKTTYAQPWLIVCVILLAKVEKNSTCVQCHHTCLKELRMNEVWIARCVDKRAVDKCRNCSQKWHRCFSERWLSQFFLCNLLKYWRIFYGVVSLKE